MLLILPSVLLPRVYLEVSLSASCLVSLTVSSQLLLFLELPPQYQFQEAFLDPPALAGSHDVLTFRVSLPRDLKLLTDGNIARAIVSFVLRANPDGCSTEAFPEWV